MHQRTIRWSLTSWVERLTNQDRFELITTMTLLFFLIRPGTEWYVRFTCISLAAIAFLYPPLKRSPAYWFTWFGFTLLVRNYINWADNHEFLYSYWCLTLGCSLLSTDKASTLKLNAQWFVGLVFSFATLWKGITPEYLNASVFHFLLTLDDRFFEISYFLGNYSVEALIHNREAVRQMETFVEVIQLERTPNIVAAQCLTWWTLFIEGTIAILFLIPNRYGLEKWRHLILLFFIITTYAPTNVIGFAWILIIMGVAQCDERFRKIQVGYLTLFIVISCFSSGHLKNFLFGIYFG